MSDVATTSSDNSGKDIQSDVNKLDYIEIDLFEKTRMLWANKKTVLLITAIFFLIGMFHYVFTPKEFSSTATLIQEVESGGNFRGGGGLLETLAGGFSFQGNTGSLSAAAAGRAPLPVNLYPIIVTSSDFQLDVIHREIQFANPDTVLSLYDYYENVYETPFRDRVYGLIMKMTIFLPRTVFDFAKSTLRSIAGSFSSSRDQQSSENDVNTEQQLRNQIQLSEETVMFSNNIQTISNEERGVMMKLTPKIELSAEGGLTTLVVTLPDRLAAAMVNAVLVEKLQEYITEYRIEKARANLEAVKEQEEEARLRYEEAQLELARFQDQNINLSTNIAQTRVEHLRNQRDLRFRVYNTIAQEVEQARMSLEQQMPIFNILEKPNLPSASSSTASPLILVMLTVFGFFVGIGVVLVRSFFRD
jgi:uncharacterized protein involved in exopolysaccharide biosynthesis